MRNLFAVVLGVAVAVFAIMIVELIGHAVYPPPADLRLDDPKAIRDYIEHAPFLALAFVPIAWAAGAFCGGAVAALAASGRRPQRFGVIVGAVLLVASAMNLWVIPHPAWLVLATPFACLIPGRIGGAVGARRDY
ncbi:hypothetical protein SAMN02745121_03377 [Nannocystis exedens]|uniref:Uncharacterized protein n=1 Tax=Nannocystis exedens TaxID=54 RepID=A0A1I1YLD2_9BACT|nr:hypothetical protein [Nannocystis exedens]PCC70294.1 hypothetical protein NAEX_03337 [Nannocystis exedens]SFE20356.1 hypothetical protein SAMN02745121_03377 [Nannocystis exedens]